MKELLSVSIDLAASGGSRVRKIQERALKESKGFRKEAALKAKSKGKTDEGAEQLVTDGDLNSHRSIVYGFNKAFPGRELSILMTGCVMRCPVVAAMFMTRKEGSDSGIVLMMIEPITKMVEILTLPAPGECGTDEQINQRTVTTPRVAMTSNQSQIYLKLIQYRHHAYTQHVY